MLLWGRKLLSTLTTTALVVFLFSTPILAKSGCCSSHDGVCCGCGAQANGRVICNDGWTESSCYYSEMVKCGGSSGGSGDNTDPPIATPAPIYVPPTSTPVSRPTTTPTPIPTSKPTPINTPIPTETPVPTLTPTPVSVVSTPLTPEVKGVSDRKTEPASTADTIGTLGTLGALGWSGHKLFKRLFSRKTS